MTIAEPLPLPAVGTRLRCIDNTDRPELTVGAVYVVVYEADLDKMPLNSKRWCPDDYRYVAIKVPTLKYNGIYPYGIFEVVK